MTFTRPWSEAEDAMLVELVASGASARQIGATMQKSRNAIIGRCLRAGIKLKQPANCKGERAPVRPRVAGCPASKPKTVILALPVVKAPPIVPALPPEPRNVPLLDLTPRDCRFPTAGVGEHTLFCGHPRGDSSYCRTHHALVYVPIELRRRAA